MLEKRILDFCEIEIHDYYLINVVYEGETIEQHHNQVLEDIAKEYFHDKPFYYVTHRKYSYAVDPTVYTRTSRIKNLKAFVVVTEEGIGSMFTKIEQIFMKKPLKVFDNLELALAWVKYDHENGDT